MRRQPMCGVPPCDRRLDRRKVAIAAAVAALFLFATVPAKAAVTSFIIDQSKSFMKIGELIDLSKLVGGAATPFGTIVYPSVPQFPDPDGAGPITGSDTTSIFGQIYATITGSIAGGGTIAPLIGGSQISFAVNNTPGAGGVPGLYAPADTAPPGYPDPVFPGSLSTFQPGSNYGFMTVDPDGAGPLPDLFLRQSQYNMQTAWLGPGRAVAPGGTFPMVPGLPLAGDGLIGTYGRLVFTSVFDSDSGDIIGDPAALMGTGGVTPGALSIDGGFLAITIPIESMYTITLDGDPGPGVTDVPVTFLASGVIYAVAIPEPSSMVLLGCGIVGLVACGYRLRKRKA